MREDASAVGCCCGGRVSINLCRSEVKVCVLGFDSQSGQYLLAMRISLTSMSIVCNSACHMIYECGIVKCGKENCQLITVEMRLEP